MVMINLSKKFLTSFFVVMLFVIGVGYVLANWTPANHPVSHDSNDVKVNISGTDYSLQEAINKNLIGVVAGNSYKQSYKFSTRYSVVMVNETFKNWMASSTGGSGLPVNGGNDHGWYIRGYDAKFVGTANKLCTYFMGDDSFADLRLGQYSGGDYGSDNNNLAYYWDSVSNSWKSESHGDNGNIDITALRCTGQGILDRGLPFLI